MKKFPKMMLPTVLNGMKKLNVINVLRDISKKTIPLVKNKLLLITVN